MPYSTVTKFLQDLVFWTLHKNTRYHTEIWSKATNKKEILNKILQLFVLCQIFNKNSAIVCLGFAPSIPKYSQLTIYNLQQMQLQYAITSAKAPSLDPNKGSLLILNF